MIGGFKMDIRSKHNLPLNERLRDLRKEHKLTQKQVAEMLDTVDSTYAGYEARENADNHRYPQIHSLKKLAEIYNTTTDYLLGLTDNKAPRKTDQDIMYLLENKKAKVDGIELDPQLSLYAISQMKVIVKMQKESKSILHQAQ
jgi:transcriptional regulator with XRE-family HTH domain